jgi:hypothetical protein
VSARYCLNGQFDLIVPGNSIALLKHGQVVLQVVVEFRPVPEVKNKNRCPKHMGELAILLQEFNSMLAGCGVGLSKSCTNIFLAVHGWKM